MPVPTTLYDFTRHEVGILFDGQPSYRVDQLWQGLYEQLNEPDEISNLPKALRSRVAGTPTGLTPISEKVSDNGKTIKWLWRLLDNTTVETVLMHYKDRSTVCVSSQAGCAMACGFCATGQSGFDRQLGIGEIVEQVIRASRRANRDKRRLSNVVFMGMGEPMANYDNTWAAVERIHGDLGLSARHITVSTVGIIPGIRRMATEELPINLAVSLHAANDSLRDELVPINRRYPLDDLIDACIDYFDSKGRRISFEWALIADTNDRLTDAQELAEIARVCRAHVNLIPLNPTPGFAVLGSSPQRVRDFANQLEGLGVNATVRNNRGNEIDAACGQLRASHETAAVQVALRSPQSET